MCSHCGDGDRAVEVTEENMPYMVREASTVAMHAASAYASGWFRGAQGLHTDMMQKWGVSGHLYMMYVWGAARFFLSPGDDDEAPIMTPGYSDLEKLAREMTGEEPDPQHLSRLVAINDQAGACIQSITQAASKGDLIELTRILESVQDRELSVAVTVYLMADAGTRMGHAKATGDQMAMDLFNAHVRAHWGPDEEDEDEGAQEGGQ